MPRAPQRRRPTASTRTDVERTPRRKTLGASACTTAHPRFSRRLPRTSDGRTPARTHDATRLKTSAILGQGQDAPAMVYRGHGRQPDLGRRTRKGPKGLESSCRAPAHVLEPHRTGNPTPLHEIARVNIQTDTCHYKRMRYPREAQKPVFLAGPLACGLNDLILLRFPYRSRPTCDTILYLVLSYDDEQLKQPDSSDTKSGNTIVFLSPETPRAGRPPTRPLCNYLSRMSPVIPGNVLESRQHVIEVFDGVSRHVTRAEHLASRCNARGEHGVCVDAFRKELLPHPKGL